MCLKEIGLCAQITILGSLVNIFGGGGVGVAYSHLMSTGSLLWSSYSMSTINDEESGYDLDLDLLTISC